MDPEQSTDTTCQVTATRFPERTQERAGRARSPYSWRFFYFIFEELCRRKRRKVELSYSILWESACSPAGLMSSSLWSWVLVGVGVGMLLVDSRSSKFLILLTEVALWVAELLNDGFWLVNDVRALDATEAGLGFVVPRWHVELIAVDALRLARFTCWAEADLVERRSSVLDSGLYPP